MSTRRPKVLILGLDGVCFELIDQFHRSFGMPYLEALRQRSVWGPLRSTFPPTTLPAWTSFLTGARPSSHGVPDFTVRHGYRIRFAGGALRALPTILSHVEDHGLLSSAAWFPATFPPEKLRGYQISGWDSPVTSRGDDSFVHPKGLHQDLDARFQGDHLAFDAIDEFRNDSSWYKNSLPSILRSIRRRAEIAQWLLEHQPTDVTGFYFGEADTAAHHFWAFHDPDSPRRPSSFDSSLSTALRDVYRELDRAVGKLVKAAGPQASIVVLSDHGSGGSSDIGIYLNRMLSKAGLLTFQSKKRASRKLTPGFLRGVMPAMVPPGLRRAAFRFAGGLAPSLVESRLRLGGIDWQNTYVFSEEVNYSPSLWINFAGREPEGIADHRDIDGLIRTVEEAISTVRTPEGEPLIKRLIKRDELHQGKLSNLFPDILLELHRPKGYAPCCLPSQGQDGEVVTRISGADLLGRKGRSLPGCHTDYGILMVAGEGIEHNQVHGASLEDVAPIVAALAGIPGASWFEGKGLEGLPWPGGDFANEKNVKKEVETRSVAYTDEEERVVAERLRRLGYLE